MSEARLTCAVPGCGQPVNGHPYGSLCHTHAARRYRHGSYRARAVRVWELKKYREPIARTIAKYRESTAIKAALAIAHDILVWRRRHEFTSHLQMEKRMARLRDEGVTARDILQRIAEVWALQAKEQRFNDEQELDYALANGVLRLRKIGTWRPTGALLRFMGRELRNELGTWAASLCTRLALDDEVRRKAKQSFETGWGSPDQG